MRKNALTFERLDPNSSVLHPLPLVPLFAIALALSHLSFAALNSPFTFRWENQFQTVKERFPYKPRALNESKGVKNFFNSGPTHNRVNPLTIKRKNFFKGLNFFSIDRAFKGLEELFKSASKGISFESTAFTSHVFQGVILREIFKDQQ